MTQVAKVHAIYIAGILLGIIIVLLTIEWGSIPSLVQYITFALTLTSLVLALLAIVYSFLSNNTISGILGRIVGATDSVAAAATDVRQATNDLDTRLSSIPPAIDALRSRVEQSHTELAYSISQLTVSPSPSLPSISTQPEPAPFLELASLNGLLILHACARNLNRAVAFSLTDYAAKVPFAEYSYTHGFLVATRAAGLLDYTLNDKIVNVTRLDSAIGASVKDVYIRRMQEQEDEAFRESMKDTLAKLDEFLA